MSFLRRNLLLKNCGKKSPTLPRAENPDPRAGERTSGAASCAASLTVEASFLIPLFLMTVYLFWTFFTAFLLHTRMQAAMDQVTAQIAQQSFLAEDAAETAGWDTSDGGISFSGVLRTAAWMAAARGSLQREIGREALNASPVRGGASGISVAASTWNPAGDICLVVRYRLVFPGLPGKLLQLPVEQVSRRKCWTGRAGSGHAAEDGSDGTELVYVAETGRVYHRDIGCYHLNVTVRKVSFSGAMASRNNSGGRYRACEHCAVSAVIPGTVYITPEGDCFHVIRDCSALKRTVSQVPLEGVGLPPCSHCGRIQEGS